MNRFSPIKIGNLELKNNLISAPLAGLSSLPFRILAMEFGCALAISEMVSAEGVRRKGKKTERYFANGEGARPYGVQLFSADARAFAEAIARLECEPIDLFDINMGCPVRKVVTRGAGSALMKDLSNAEKIISACRSATKWPLTVKFRSGWDEGSLNCVELAKVAEGSGADAVCIHPRTKVQEFKGKADWSFIGKVKSAVKIPVIGNGDVHSRGDAIRMMDETGCDAVMIGRAAVGRPWIFRQIVDENFSEPDVAERGRILLRHLELLREFSGEKFAAMNIKAALPWYVKGMQGSKEFLRAAMSISDCCGMTDAVREYFRTQNSEHRTQ